LEAIFSGGIFDSRLRHRVTCQGGGHVCVFWGGGAGGKAQAQDIAVAMPAQQDSVCCKVCAAIQ